jgi:hypothetical protein
MYNVWITSPVLIFFKLLKVFGSILLW